MTFANVGGADRAVRLIAGLTALTVGLGLLGATRGEVAGIVVSIVGVVMLLTAIVGFCPAYLPFGLSTCKARAN
ncbi:MAG: DUF2892 domain-containing protein [Planctomycetes bacterium]|nr:DUF2892 domain-containing protein [Planctomycetota bacterium]